MSRRDAAGCGHKSSALPRVMHQDRSRKQRSGSLAIVTARRFESGHRLIVALGASKMPHVCALITIAMQLTCVVDKEILCTDNESLAQLLNMAFCERVFSHHDGADVSPGNDRPMN